METRVFCTRMKDGLWLARVTKSENGFTSVAESKKHDLDDAMCIALLRAEFDLKKQLGTLSIPVKTAEA